MKNIEIANIFYEMADILEMQDVKWKPNAYRKAARSIESLSVDIEDIAKKGLKTVEEIPGVGEGIAKKIIEYCNTGKIKEYLKLKKSIPKHIDALMQVPGMGPKKAKRLFKELKISTLKQLETAAEKHKIEGLKGFGEKSEQDITRGLGLLKSSKGRMLLGIAYPIAEEIKKKLSELKQIEKIEIAGSLRRMKETIGDIDLLAVSSDPEKVMDYFCKLPDVNAVLSKGSTKSIVFLKSGIQADLRVIKTESFGAALQYFTGNKDHNIKLRNIAIKKGYKLNEYALSDRNTGKYIAGKTEQDVYRKLGLRYIPPEMREDTGELQLKNIPDLVELKDIRGDFHLHTKWSDGSATIKEMAEAAKARGYEYICISDHSHSQRIAHGMDIDRLLKYIKEIKKTKVKGIKIFTGTECDILKGGELDYPDEILKKLDIVIAAAHLGFKNSRAQIMHRYKTAIENKYVDIIAHPIGRLLGKREGFNLDIDKLIDLVAKNKKIIEIDSQPERLDLDWLNLKKAAAAGIKISIDSDAHSIQELEFMKYGVATARRGWTEKKNVVNALPLSRLKFGE